MLKDNRVVTEDGLTRARKFYKRLKAINDAREEFDKTLESEKLDGSTIVADMFGEIGYGEDLQAVQEYLLAQLCILNGVGAKPYIKKSSKIKQNIQPFDEEFIKESALWGKYEEMFPQSTQTFKARFLTALTTHYIVILNDVVELYTKKPFEKKRTKALRQIADRFVDLMIAMLNDANYADELNHVVYEIMALDKTHESAIALLRDNRRIIKCFDGDIEWSEQKFITKILKESFNLVTNTRGILKPRIKIDDDEDILKDKQSVQGMVRMLGASIIAQAKRKNGKLSPIYLAWSMSKPRIETRFKHVGSDPNLNQGCRALEFWAFISDDPCVTKFVNDLIH